MTPTQALEILKQLAAMAPVNLQAHIQGQQALEVLKKALDEKAS